MEVQTVADELPLGLTEQPKTETKSEAFDRIAPGRVNRALDAIRLVGNLANRSSYEYSALDVDLMLQAMRQTLADVESKFRVNSPRQEFQFRR